ncbi:unnamed protein product [Lactuca saligna]|uniref:Helitron helicase-like domain-containing protein n=1 Tax=Lactuca saligna TaxID=75948 RepID=A0AA35VLD9_LACSI|nr:unnamed protein product [Lactuca saligna]
MNGHIYVDAFSLLLNYHLWYVLTSVRVDFIWRDSRANKLFMVLIDQNREKLLAVVPQQMMRFIYEGNLLGGVFSLNHFQIEPTYAEYPRYQEYSLLRGDLMIKISNNTRFNRLADAIISWFPCSMGTVDKGNENCDDSQNPIDIEKENRKRYNRNYYARKKEKNKKRRIANGEGCSQPTTLTSCTIMETNETNINEDSSVSVISAAQRTSTYNKEYYQRRKERTMMTKRRVYAFQDDPYDFVYENIRMEHRILKAQNPCVYCGAKRLQYEFPTFCCMSGKTKLAHSPIPTELHQLFTRQEQLEESFRDGKSRYLQLYFYDGEAEISQRSSWKNVDRRIIQKLTRILASNPYVRTFKQLSDLGPLDNYRVTLNASVELDQRVYNKPTTSEV